MNELGNLYARRTTTDAVFDELRDEIVSLRLLPGAKLSEAEIARRFGVSRQPVRDAFARLEHMNLLLIRPQKATEVRGFSMPQITHARFVRIALELEVLRHACAVWNSDCVEAVEKNLQMQEQAISLDDSASFHELDYEFHKMICELSGLPLAFESIKETKQEVDRLCVLSLDRADESSAILDDHRRLAAALQKGSADSAIQIARQHFSRLDETIADIHAAHPEYFE
jgi:DNA-binding GntR family transcriptional regulator